MAIFNTGLSDAAPPRSMRLQQFRRVRDLIDCNAAANWCSVATTLFACLVKP